MNENGNEYIKCPFCKEEVLKGALICKHCKNKIPPEANPKQLLLGFILIGLFIYIILLPVIFNPSPKDSNNNSISTPSLPDISTVSLEDFLNREEASIRTDCQMNIRSMLKAPSTANFPWLDGTHRSASIMGGKIIIRGDVDSENSFGAMIRNVYTCEVERNGSDYTIVNIKFDE